MKLLHNAFRWLMLKRFPQVQYWMQHPFETQNLHFSYLMYRGARIPFLEKNLNFRP